ncbi:MAG TPA: methyltransferase domain-containing protein [bacterium]|nr:methyltransferase domain-containing protein [bacterium]
MAVKTAEHAQEVYDRVAQAYDDLWSKNVAEPNAKLTRGLKLKPGERIVDLACGTGAFTLEMAKLVEPGETVGVDYSEGMLANARERAIEANLPITLVHSKAEDFIEHSHPESFDVLSARFLLAYVDWKDVLPKMGRLVRKGGRVAVLTSTSASIPQAQEIYKMFMAAFNADMSFPAPVPESLEQVVELVKKGGVTPVDTWTYRIRLWFDNGQEAAYWMRESGYGTHPSLGVVSEEVVQQIEGLFAAGMESFREKEGLPLDIVVAGVVAEKK